MCAWVFSSSFTCRLIGFDVLAQRLLLGGRVAAGVHDGALPGGIVNQQVGIFGESVEGKTGDRHSKAADLSNAERYGAEC